MKKVSFFCPCNVIIPIIPPPPHLHLPLHLLPHDSPSIPGTYVAICWTALQPVKQLAMPAIHHYPSSLPMAVHTAINWWWILRFPDNSPHQNSPHDYSPLDNSPHDYSPLDNSPHDYSPLDNSPHDYSPLDNSPHDYSPYGQLDRKYVSKSN